MTTKKSTKAGKANKSKPTPNATTAKASAKPSKPEEKSTATAKPLEKAKATATKAGGLRKPQIRILAALKKAGKELTRKEISEKAPVDNAFCTEYLGASDPVRRAKNDAKFPSLLTLKFIKASEGDAKAVTTYTITAAGVKALETAKAE